MNARQQSTMIASMGDSFDVVEPKHKIASVAIDGACIVAGAVVGVRYKQPFLGTLVGIIVGSLASLAYLHATGLSRVVLSAEQRATTNRESQVRA